MFEETKSRIKKIQLTKSNLRIYETTSQHEEMNINRDVRNLQKVLAEKDYFSRAEM